METKNPNEAVIKDLQWLQMEHSFIVSPHCPRGGGLYLGWKKEVDITIHASAHNFIDTKISHKGVSFQASFIYGEPDHTKRREVWDAISNLNMSTEEPWFLTRDFNEIVDNSEKSGGPVGAEETFCNVRSFLSQNDLFDLKHSGNFLSWRGKRHSHTVHCRPDRAMSNSAWIDLFLSCRSQYLQFEASDHRPLLTFLDPTRKKGKRLFRYDRRLRDNPEVKKSITDIWNSFPHLPVRVKLTKCRQAISNWSREFQINSKKTIEDLRSKLEATMSAFDPRDDLIHDINLQLLKAYKAEEEFWKQRSRQLWLTLGDNNTGYFHAITNGRKAKNRLTVIEDDEGTAWFEEKEVFTVISQYYTKLFTSYSTNGSVVINKALFQKLTPEYERGTSQATLSVRNKRSHVRYSSG